MNIAPDTLLANHETFSTDKDVPQNTRENELPSPEQLQRFVQLLLDELKKWNAKQALEIRDPLVHLSSRISDLYQRFALESPNSVETQWLRKVVSEIDFLQNEPVIKARLAPSIDRLLRNRLTGALHDGIGQGNDHLPTNQQKMVDEMNEFDKAMQVEIPKAIGKLEILLDELENIAPAKTEEII